ncbi:cytosine permease [Weissella cibaria]|uniref:cytosine permease n=1 Tax=Weissella cibaria TaxID=137591 RepID=UPI00143F1129|nr:cytosine permease [Weissella cibaria]MBU7544435.1 cytosine permease [Weissella cibaria]MCV3318173.1 cytosine permease [Weissella cibaria]NKN31433.1 cytosine permease [Weissella cibaria]NKN80311.1 cytosine permease [Weissella cibaria]NKN97635.1 cytosine permease [Weissella cibaria]
MEKRFGQVEAISTDKRTMSNWDMFATWVGANANNGTWYIGGVIAAAGMYTASTTLIISGLVSYALLALASFMGFKTGLPMMALTRASFGLRGSFLPSIINIVQFIGWAAANTFIAAISISVIFKDLFGWQAYTAGGKAGLVIGIIIMSLLHLASISLGERSVRMIERIGIILVAIFVIWESIVVFQHVSLADIFAWTPPAKVRISSGAAIDILAAFNLAWVTASSDFSRFTKRKSGATGWSFLGANIGLFWFAFIGLTATIATALMNNAFDPNDSDPSTIASKLGLGIIALLVIVITSTTANAVNLMAAGSALTNMWHKLKLTPALWIVTIGATLVSFIPLWFATFLDAFILFLDYIGMFLGPEIAVFLVDFFFIRKGQYELSEFTKVDGKYWYNGGLNWLAIGAWLIGIALYFGLKSVDIISQTIGVTFVAMALTGVIYYIAAKLLKK